MNATDVITPNLIPPGMPQETQEDEPNDVLDMQHKLKPEWNNEPTVLQLKGDLEEAKPGHDAQVSRIENWLDNLYIRGKAKIKGPENRSKVVPQIIRKQAEWRYPALTEPFLSADDIFDVRPVTWEDRDAARQNKILLNNQFNTKIDKVAFVDEYVRCAVNQGTVAVKLGWCFEEETVIETKPIVELTPDQNMLPLMEEIAQLQIENPAAFRAEVPEELKQAFMAWQDHGVPFAPAVVGEQQVEVTKTVKNHPTLEVCDLRNLIIDPSCGGDADKANFFIDSFPSSLAELEKDGRYVNLQHINVEGNSILAEADHHLNEQQSNFNFSDKPRKQFIVHEYWGFWDVEGNGELKPIVAAWVGNVMIRMEEAPFPDKKLPFVVVSYLPLFKQIYGEPDGELLEDNQKIIGAVTRGSIDLMGRSANGQRGYRKGALDAVNRRRFERGEDYEYNGAADPRVAFHMHQFPEIPQSAYAMIQMQQGEAEELTGAKPFAMGDSTQALGQSATAARGVLDATSKRELSLLRRLASGMTKIARKIIAMNAVFLDEEEIVRVTNDEFVPIQRDDLAGEFDLRLDISTAEENNAKAQELAFMLQTMGPDEDPEIRKMILADICKLRKMPDLAKKLESYQPEPDPIQQELAMLEVQKVKAEIANLLSQANENDAEAELDLAKARESIAKASHLMAETDQKNLDFVEQESGVKQERDLEKQGAQARANMELKHVDAQLKERIEDKKLLTKYQLEQQKQRKSDA